MAKTPDSKLSREQAKLTPEELKLDVQARVAESILQGIDPDIQIEWVRESEARFEPGVRRVIQMKG